MSSSPLRTHYSISSAGSVARHFALVGFAGLVVTASIANAQSTKIEPNKEALRSAVKRSLPLLQSSAETWFEKRRCSSCHHQGVGLMAVAVARERGFAIDEALVRGQLERTIRPSLDWQEKYVTGEVSINEAIGQSYRVVGVGTAGGTPTVMTDAIGYLLAGRQHVSGRWSSYSRRPPLEDSEFTATAVSIRALKLFPLKGRLAETEARIARARAWLGSARPQDTEDRVMQLLGLAWADASSAELTGPAAALGAEQRADGGWAQIATRGSDSYATGLAIVALNQAARMPLADSAIQRGLGYLLATQHPDGSWHVATRRTIEEGLPYFESGYPHGKDQFISYAGGAWATMGLALGEREEVSPSLMGVPSPRMNASPTSNEPDGLSSLMRAALYGTADDLDRLLAEGADVNASSSNGLTALMCAVHDPAKVRRLLSAGADPKIAARTGHPALTLAAGYDTATESVALLLAAGAPIDVPIASGNLVGATALGRAVARGDLRVADTLLRNGANLEGVVAGAFSPVLVATSHGDAPTLEWLIGRGANVNVRRSRTGKTALMIAVENGYDAVVAELLKHGADLNAVDKAGFNALSLAAATIDHGTTHVVDRLLQAGAKATMTELQADPPAALARKWGKPHVAARLDRLVDDHK